MGLWVPLLGLRMGVCVRNAPTWFYMGWVMFDFDLVARSIRLVLTDIDGVLTDGRLLYGPQGEMLKTFHTRDGMAVGMLRDAGIALGFLSGRTSPPLIARASDLGITMCHLGVKNKELVLDEILASGEFAVDEICYIGDDLPDLGVLRRVGLSAAPADAAAAILEVVDYRCIQVGGGGVLREVVEQILARRGL